MEENRSARELKDGDFPPLLDRLFKPVDIASLVFFRIAFGLLMLREIMYYFQYGWIEKQFINPAFHFTYYGFGWVAPWPGNGMYYHFFALGILALGIAFGFYYRITTILFFLGFTHVFLIDQANYLNHFYLICLVSFLMIFVPTHRNFSFDSWKNPAIRSNTVSAWALWLMRIQIGIPYFFGGIAKINPDWLHGEPMRTWLKARTNFPLIGQFFNQEWAVYFFSYGGMLFDLLVVPFLLWKKTRPLAYVCVLIFNLTNAWLFNIGIFPWFMIAATTLFFEPDWPRRFLKFSKNKAVDAGVVIQNETNSTRKYLTVSLLGIYLLVQFSLPFRHLLYPGVVHWTEEGHQFSWHMKLRDKRGRAKFFIQDIDSNKKTQISAEKFLTAKQYNNMITDPDMIIQFAHYLAKKYSSQPGQKVAVYADIVVSLNNRPFQQFTDPNVNLAKEERSLKHVKWIVPLK